MQMPSPPLRALPVPEIHPTFDDLTEVTPGYLSIAPDSGNDPVGGDIRRGKKPVSGFRTESANSAPRIIASKYICAMSGSNARNWSKCRRLVMRLKAHSICHHRRLIQEYRPRKEFRMGRPS